MKRAIKQHTGDFAAILALFVGAVVVAGYILSHERLRFPLIQSAPFTVNAELASAQAVTPGQGQAVRVSGVQIGQIGNVSLHRGVAVVQMNIDQRYRRLIHTNATALVRPRTGLADMFIELDPGTAAAPFVRSGFTIPVSNTLPAVNLDEIEAALDTDTRAYLALLVNGAGTGLHGGGGSDLAQVLERFEPTHRDLARVSRALAVRGANLRRLVSSLQRLNTVVAGKQSQVVSLVESSSRVFRALASQGANLSRSVGDLPSTLRQTTRTLGQVRIFAGTLAPTARNLLPAARVLPAASRAVSTLAGPNGSTCGSTSSCAIVRDEIRPFVVAARPLVRELRPASANLAAATPNLSQTLTVANDLLNMAGYNPGGRQHGYLWWLAWLDHNARTLFSIQDANGAFRPLFVQAGCGTYASLVQNNPLAAALINPTISGICRRP